MLFLNISTDQVFIQIQDETINLDRHEIENIIWPTIIKLYKKYNFDKVFLLNWPGWFTNLRVWTLALNLLNSLENWKIDIFSCTKIKLFKYFVEQKQLPNQWIIYIWQKKNIRLYDFIKWNYETIKKTDINTNIDINNKKLKSNLFFDLVYDQQYFDSDNKIDINLKNEKIILTYNNQSLETNIEKLWLKAEKMTEPKYFIQPIMWNKWQ